MRNTIIVSHGDLLSIFHAMWLGMEVEMLNRCELFGMAGGVSFMRENEDGKRIINRLSDMSYLMESMFTIERQKPKMEALPQCLGFVCRKPG